MAHASMAVHGLVISGDRGMPDDKPRTIDEVKMPQPESDDPEYLAWKKARIWAAIEHADAHPDDCYDLDKVAEEIAKRAPKQTS